MSDDDRDKWNQRYGAGAYQERLHPSELVAKCLPQILATQRAAVGPRAPLRALDLACGAGRNALYLAEHGYRVDALDIAAEALARGSTRAKAKGLAISWIEHDLDQGLPRRLTHYDVVVIMRYLDLSLVKAAVERLRPGGYLVCEAHLVTEQPVIGPHDANFRVRSGELSAAAAPLDIAEYWEGVTQDPDGRNVALARLVACRLHQIG
jgi:2-polyprenyl-3-methyl-5-hydroxy-6-metoxy-1,4-benzoquinol methylase